MNERHSQTLHKAARAGKWSFIREGGYYSSNGLTAATEDREQFLSVELDRMGRVFRWTRYRGDVIAETGRVIMWDILNGSEPDDMHKLESAVQELSQGPTYIHE